MKGNEGLMLGNILRTLKFLIHLQLRIVVGIH